MSARGFFFEDVFKVFFLDAFINGFFLYVRFNKGGIFVKRE